MNSEQTLEIEKIKELFSNGWITEYECNKRINEIDPTFKPKPSSTTATTPSSNEYTYDYPINNSNDYYDNSYRQQQQQQPQSYDYSYNQSTQSNNTDIVFKSYDDIPVLNNNFSEMSLNTTTQTPPPQPPTSTNKYNYNTFNNNKYYNNNNHNNNYNSNKKPQVKPEQELPKVPVNNAFAMMFATPTAKPTVSGAVGLNNDPSIRVVGWDHGVKFDFTKLASLRPASLQQTYIDLRDWLKETNNLGEPDIPTKDKSDKWKQEQFDLAKRVDKKNQLVKTTLIGGVDISFAKNNKIDACASLVVIQYPSLKLVYQSFKMVKLTEPYIAGYLAFREAPHLMPLWNDLITNFPQFKPDVLIVDGNGVNHMRACGAACHLGVLMDIPTIGVAKTLLYANGITEEYITNGFKKDKVVEMIHQTDKSSLGYAMYNSSSEIIYISPGHKIDSKTALQVVQNTLNGRSIPEPTHQADRVSRDFLFNFYQKLKSTR